MDIFRDLVGGQEAEVERGGGKEEEQNAGAFEGTCAGVNVCNTLKTSGGSCDSSFQFTVASLPNLLARIILAGRPVPVPVLIRVRSAENRRGITEPARNRLDSCSRSNSGICC